MVRQTSIKAYNRIRDCRLLKKIQWRIYSHLFHHGPKTSGEAYRSLRPPHKTPSQIRARFTELRAMGVLREVGERPCRVTGRTCILWDVTKALPRKLPEPVPCPSIRVFRAASRSIRTAYRRAFGEKSVPKGVVSFLAWARYEVQKKRRRKP